MKLFKVLYKEVNVQYFIVPAKSKREAAQLVKDRIYHDLQPINETSEDYSIKDIEYLEKLPINLEDKNNFEWWQTVQESRKNWLKSIQEKLTQ